LAHKANIPRNRGVLVDAVSQYRTRFPTVGKWGAFGLCWGGKVSCTSQPSKCIAMLTCSLLR
jgi:dienelactone hydrolase